MWQKGHSETEDLKLHLKKPCSFYMESLGMITLGNTSLRTQSLCHEEDRQTEIRLIETEQETKNKYIKIGLQFTRQFREMPQV